MADLTIGRGRRGEPSVGDVRIDGIWPVTAGTDEMVAAISRAFSDTIPASDLAAVCSEPMLVGFAYLSAARKLGRRVEVWNGAEWLPN